MKEESLLLLSDLQKLINQVVLIDYTIIILGGILMTIAVSDLTGSLTGILKEDYDLDIEKEERLKEKYELQFTILIS